MALFCLFHEDFGAFFCGLAEERKLLKIDMKLKIGYHNTVTRLRRKQVPDYA